MNWDFFTHVIRDVFNPEDSIVCYNKAYPFLEFARNSKHSLETWVLNSDEALSINSEFIHFWNPMTESFFGNDFCKLFIAFEHDPKLFSERYDSFEETIKIIELMKSGGIILLIDSYLDGLNLSAIFKQRLDLEKQTKQYSFLRDRNILVYQKIEL